MTGRRDGAADTAEQGGSFLCSDDGVIKGLGSNTSGRGGCVSDRQADWIYTSQHYLIQAEKQTLVFN